jgi:hypothetical protein
MSSRTLGDDKYFSQFANKTFREAVLQLTRYLIRYTSRQGSFRTTSIETLRCSKVEAFQNEIRVFELAQMTKQVLQTLDLECIFEEVRESDSPNPTPNFEQAPVTLHSK